jgi:hypothetical protein
MAFDEAQRLEISDILEITPDELNSQMIYLGDRLTAGLETKILGKVAEWPGVSGNYASFTPTESNQGFNLSADAAKLAIRRSIAKWLEMPDYGTGSDMIPIERG